MAVKDEWWDRWALFISNTVLNQTKKVRNTYPLLWNLRMKKYRIPGKTETYDWHHDEAYKEIAILASMTLEE